MPWSPEQYSKFETERNRPALDLLARCPADSVATAIDVGCGPGNSTELLRAHLPGAAIRGVDSSPEMIAAARARLPGIHFELGDAASLAGAYDLIFANAVLQWVPNHESIVPALLDRLAPGGTLAVQMPDNLDEPAHRVMRALALDGPWAAKLAGAAAARAERKGMDWYYNLLRTAGAAPEVWRTTYLHPLAGTGALVEWFKGTGLRPFLEPLDDDERAAFLECYQARLAEAYPPLPDGTILLRFPRLFFTACRA